MTTQDTVSLHLAQKLAECGYRKYADTQYVLSKDSGKYEKLHYDIWTGFYFCRESISFGNVWTRPVS